MNTPEESKALNMHSGPMIIIAASGMATGGRVIHHLKAFAPDSKNMILLVGYQAAGTRGASLLQGAKTLRIHGGEVPVRAEIAMIQGLSGHADQGARFERLFSATAIPILVIGMVMHAWGMFDKNRIEKGAGTLPRFELYLYWVCWILLLVLPLISSIFMDSFILNSI